MMKNKNSTINIGVFGSRIFDGCKTILQLGLGHCLIGVLIFSVGCNPSTTNYHNQTIQPGGSTADPTKQGFQTGGPGSGGGGTGDGGGGQGVYCSETVKDTNLKGKLMVRDVYEAIKNHKRTMPSDKLGAGGSEAVDEGAIQHLVGILKTYFGPASGNLDYVNTEFWKKFSDNISFIAEDATLHPSQDANSPLALPEGCKIVQIAYWDESSGPVEDGTLYVDKRSWKQLDQFNKIALLAHEFFFKQARKAGYKNSDFVRYKVGQLLSKEGLPTVFQQWMPSGDSRVRDVLPADISGFKFCKGSSESDLDASLQMYQYLGKDGNQHLVFPVVSSNDVNFSLFYAPHVVFHQEKNESVALITDLLVPTSHFKGDISSLYMNSGITDIVPNYRYAKTGFVSKDLKHFLNFKPVLQGIFTGETRTQDAVWAVKNREKTVTISMNNPIKYYKPTKEEKRSREELIRDLLVTIRSDLLMASKGQQNPMPFDQIEASILVLDNEVQSFVEKGVYPTSFPLWQAELLKLNKVVISMGWEQGQRYVRDSEFDKNLHLTQKYPKALYDLKKNSYVLSNITDIVKVDPKLTEAPPESFNLLNLGSITFSQESGKTTFNLDCKDWIDIYNEQGRKKSDGTEVNSIPSVSIKFALDDASFGLNDTSDKTLTEDFLNFLRSKNIDKKDIVREIYGALEWNPREVTHKHLNGLFADLQSEGEVVVSKCFGYPVPLKIYEDVINVCNIFELKKTGKKYLLVHSHGPRSFSSDDRRKPSVSLEYLHMVP